MTDELRCAGAPPLSKLWLPILDREKEAAIKGVLATHGFHAECRNQVLFEMRELGRELEPYAPRQGPAWKPTRWLERLQRAAEGKDDADKLLSLLSEVHELSDRQLRQLFSPPVYGCHIHADVLSRKPGDCPTCDALWLERNPKVAAADAASKRKSPRFPLQVRWELEASFLKELAQLQHTIAAAPKDPGRWRTLARDVALRAKNEVSRSRRSGPPDQPLARWLVWGLAHIYRGHVVNTVLYSWDPINGKSLGEGLDFITQGLEFYGFSERGRYGVAIKRATVRQYLERRPYRINRAHCPIA